MTVSKLDEGVSSGKLNEPPKSCIPNKAKMKMNKNNKNKREMIEERAFIRAKGLKKKRKSIGRSEQGLIKKKVWDITLLRKPHYISILTLYSR